MDDNTELRMVLADKNNNFLSEIYFHNGQLLVPSNNIFSVSDYDLKDIMSTIFAGVYVQIPYENNEDFIYQYIAKPCDDHLPYIYDENLLIGRRFSDIYPKLVELGELDIRKKVFRTGISTEYKILIFYDDMLIQSITKRVMRHKNNIISFAKNDTPSEMFSKQLKYLIKLFKV